jgi:hypothetical protein
MRRGGNDRGSAVVARPDLPLGQAVEALRATRGGPTSAQQAEGARRPASDRSASAQSALEQARSFDGSGQETQCMEAIERAKRLAP